jgi:hypothetical protein
MSPVAFLKRKSRPFARIMPSRNCRCGIMDYIVVSE